MNRFFFVEMGAPNAIIEGFHEIRSGSISRAELVEPFSFPNPLLRFLNRARYSRRFRDTLQFIPHGLWSRWHAIRRLSLTADGSNFVVLMPGTDIDRLILPQLLRDIRSQEGVKVRLILLLFDPIDSPLKSNGWGSVRDVFPLFDLVATFDKRDAEQYGLLHFTDPYAPRAVDRDEQLATDVFFIGHEKGRLDRLCAIADHLTHGGVKFRILLAGVTDTEKAVAHGLTPMVERAVYSDVLKHVAATRCLLEVLCDGQMSSSLRYYEAVVYNKKLLTDNHSVVELPKFNSKYVRCFDGAGDIEADWILDTSPVDYGYIDEFSVVRLMELLEHNASPTERSP